MKEKLEDLKYIIVMIPVVLCIALVMSTAPEQELTDAHNAILGITPILMIIIVPLAYYFNPYKQKPYVSLSREIELHGVTGIKCWAEENMTLRTLSHNYEKDGVVVDWVKIMSDEGNYEFCFINDKGEHQVEKYHTKEEVEKRIAEVLGGT